MPYVYKTPDEFPDSPDRPNAYDAHAIIVGIEGMTTVDEYGRAEYRPYPFHSESAFGDVNTYHDANRLVTESGYERIAHY